MKASRKLAGALILLCILILAGLFFGWMQVVKLFCFGLLMIGFSWVLAECDRFQNEHPPTISVGEKRVLRR